MPTPSLVPITIQESWIKQLAGVSLSGVKITLIQNSEKRAETKRSAIKDTKILFTHIGMSGPTILNMSAEIRELLDYEKEDGPVTLSIDLLPQHDYGKLNKKLQETFAEHSNKKFKNCLGSGAGELVPSAVANVIIDRLVKETGIDPEKPVNLVSREERLALVQVLKHFTVTVKGLLGFEKAVIASGGIDIREVDSKTMQSRMYPNLSVVGDVLDIDRPSGGYSLQLCWTTGYVAGSHIEK